MRVYRRDGRGYFLTAANIPSPIGSSARFRTDCILYSAGAWLLS